MTSRKTASARRKVKSSKYVRVGLERFQRIWCELDDEPMPFTSKTVAQMLHEIADQIDEDLADFVRSVAHTMEGRDKNHVLELKQRHPGKFLSADRHTAHYLRRSHAAALVAHLESQGHGKEAAVAAASAELKRSRSWVFKMLAEQRDWDAMVTKLRTDAPEILVHLKTAMGGP